jgi:TerC family integral membrane protein|eukprot:CAMPEP_0195298092 /NCGR_PEP_ID=MMETSP0707-20130614/22757_1 /TAXON_ID=33640 /ORGANISM="Asterionellopsis glacialis, Strain CCMP134" /LENGTH=314 /DNA_ID=CAMNT_0040360087 /DNA_START=371 /DNA_END=1315 /DNA_ORIENTATION=-
MTKEKTEVASSQQQPSLFEPGGGPTIVIDEDESPKEIYQQAIQRTLFWVVAAAVFGGGIYALAGPETAEEFYAGYLVEQSLSVDNLFVFLLLFDFFRVPLNCQDRVLNWGIYGAIVMRATMIGIGAAALHEFHAILLVFAGILVYSSLKVLVGGDEDEEEDMSENSIVQFSNRLIESTDEFDGDRFFTLVDGVKKATPLFICMIAVEISDVVFAVDSIPAVFGVTDNPLVVFSSNMFAIMGLRSLYTILSKAAQDLKYLEPAVAFVLGFIGAKMIGEYFGYNVPTEDALAVVATLLGGGVGLSLVEKKQTAKET